MRKYTIEYLNLILFVCDLELSFRVDLDETAL